MLADTRAPPRFQRNECIGCSLYACVERGLWKTLRQRRAVLIAVHRHEARSRFQRQLVGGFVRTWTGEAERRHADGDERRMARKQLRGQQPKLFAMRRRQRLDQDIRAFQQTMHLRNQVCCIVCDLQQPFALPDKLPVQRTAICRERW